MEIDLICHIYKGGLQHFIETGEYRQQYRFTSKTFNVSTRRRKLKDGMNSGVIKDQNKQPLFYFELDSLRDSLKAYRIENGIRERRGFDIAVILTMID